jgi:hypothetical protein
MEDILASPAGHSDEASAEHSGQRFQPVVASGTLDSFSLPEVLALLQHLHRQLELIDGKMSRHLDALMKERLEELEALNQELMGCYQSIQQLLRPFKKTLGRGRRQQAQETGQEGAWTRLSDWVTAKAAQENAPPELVKDILLRVRLIRELMTGMAERGERQRYLTDVSLNWTRNALRAMEREEQLQSPQSYGPSAGLLPDG